jgi:hypothetical protein
LYKPSSNLMSLSLKVWITLLQERWVDEMSAIKMTKLRGFNDDSESNCDRLLGFGKQSSYLHLDASSFSWRLARNEYLSTPQDLEFLAPAHLNIVPPQNKPITHLRAFIWLHLA